MKKAFQYKLPKKPAIQTLRKIRIDKEPEFLSGQIDGRKASEPEERLANASRRYASFSFEFAVNGFRGQPGYKEIDFLFQRSGAILAVEVDEMSFIHRGELQGQDPDDLIRLEGLRKLGINVPEIIHIDAAKLATREDADRVARELFT